MRAHAQPIHRQAARIARLHSVARPARGAAVRAILHGPRVQPKLTIGAANDPAETEADRVADQVMRMPAVETTSATPPTPVDGNIVRRICSQSDEEAQRKPAANTIQRLCTHCEEELNRMPAEENGRRVEDEKEEEELRLKPAGAPAAGAAERAAAAVASGGAPMPPALRAYFEPRFGTSLADVRLHTHGKAHAAAQSISAQAYTLGRNIAFAPGQYAFETAAGRRLLAHELAHTIQQAENNVARTRGAKRMWIEAERAANAVSDGPPAQFAAGRTEGLIQRQRSGVSVRSPVFEETVTQLSDVAASVRGSPLTRSERQLAEGVFGSSIDYNRVRLVPLGVLEFRTVGNNIYIPQDFSITNAYHAQTLIHELTHVWQYQHSGTSYISLSLVAQIGGALRGSRNLAYDYVTVAGASFFDYNPEQQALIVENYYSMKRDQQEITKGATVASYVSNHFDSAGRWIRFSAADRLAEIQRELPIHVTFMAQVRASVPRPEIELLQQRAMEVMQSERGNVFRAFEERIAPVRPLIEIRF